MQFEALSADLGVGLAVSAISGACTVGSMFLVNRIALDSRLTGRWEGELLCGGPAAAKFSSHVIKCVLVLARPVKRKNSGLLYYRRECSSTNKILMMGLNELQSYRKFPRKVDGMDLTMEFNRQFHKCPDGQVVTSDAFEGDPDFENTRRLSFQCRFENMFELHVKTEIANYNQPDTWSGVLKKH